MRTETEQLGGNGRPLRSARPAPRVPGAERGDVRPLFPRAPGSQDSDSVSRSGAPELGRPAGLGVASRSPRAPSEATHVLTFLRDSPLFTVRQGGRAPSGPRRRTGGACLAGPTSNEAKGPLRPKTRPSLCGPRSWGRRGLHHLLVQAPEGLPPTQESQRCREQAPASFWGICSQFSLLTFSGPVSINGSMLIITIQTSAGFRVQIKRDTRPLHHIKPVTAKNRSQEM